MRPPKLTVLPSCTSSTSVHMHSGVQMKFTIHFPRPDYRGRWEPTRNGRKSEILYDFQPGGDTYPRELGVRYFLRWILLPRKKHPLKNSIYFTGGSHWKQHQFRGRSVNNSRRSMNENPLRSAQNNAVASAYDHPSFIRRATSTGQVSSSSRSTFSNEST